MITFPPIIAPDWVYCNIGGGFGKLGKVSVKMMVFSVESLNKQIFFILYTLSSVRQGVLLPGTVPDAGSNRRHHRHHLAGLSRPATHSTSASSAADSTHSASASHSADSSSAAAAASSHSSRPSLFSAGFGAGRLEAGGNEQAVGAHQERQGPGADHLH